MCLHSTPLQSPHDATRFLRTAGIKGCTDGGRGRGVRPAMPSHQQIKVMGFPAPATGPDALAVQAGGKIGIGGHAGRAELIEQKAQLVWCARAGTVHGRHCHAEGVPFIDGACEIYGVYRENLRGSPRANPNQLRPVAFCF
jgi:hypothetical protein